MGQLRLNQRAVVFCPCLLASVLQPRAGRLSGAALGENLAAEDVAVDIFPQVLVSAGSYSLGESLAQRNGPTRAQVNKVLQFLATTDEVNKKAVDTLADRSMFPDDDLTPPVLDGVSNVSKLTAPLSKLNMVTLDYRGNWDVRHGDSIILECGHTSAEWGDRKYFTRHIDGARNPAQAHLSETRCPLGCFDHERKKLHNKIFTSLIGQTLYTDTCLTQDSECFQKSLSECNRTDSPEIPGEAPQELQHCSGSPRAVFIIGVPASGKDTLLKAEVIGLVGDEIKSADPDDIKSLLVREGKDAYAELVQMVEQLVKSDAKLPEFIQRSYSIDQILAQHVHRESILLSYFMVQHLMKACSSFTVQKTGTRWKGQGGLKGFVVDIKRRGYEVHVMMAHAHPYNIWLNQLHRTKTFGSAGRAMARDQVISDSTKFPIAVREMLEDVNAKKVQIDGMKMLVYRDMHATITTGEKPIDLFTSEQKIDRLVEAWNPFGNDQHSANEAITERLTATRQRLMADLRETPTEDIPNEDEADGNATRNYGVRRAGPAVIVVALVGVAVALV